MKATHPYAIAHEGIPGVIAEDPSMTANQGPVLLETMRGRAATRRGWVEASVEELQTLTGIDFHDIQKVLRQWRGMSLVKFSIQKRGGSEVITGIRFTPAGLRYEYPKDRIEATNGHAKEHIEAMAPIEAKIAPAASRATKGTTPAQVAEIVQMRDAGASFVDIGKHFGFSGENARYLYHKHKAQNGAVKPDAPEAVEVAKADIPEPVKEDAKMAEAEASVALDSPSANGVSTAKPSGVIHALDLAGTDMMALRVQDLEAERETMGARVADLEREKERLLEQLRRSGALQKAEQERIERLRRERDEARAALAQGTVPSLDLREYPLIAVLNGRQERLLSAAANIEVDAPDLAMQLIARAEGAYSPFEREVVTLLGKIGVKP